MPRYRLAMFDFDGTLADSLGWFFAAMKTMGPRHGLRALDDAELEALRGLDARAIMARLGLSWWKLPAFTREMRRRMHADVAGITRFDGIDALFSGLKSHGVDIAIVTSNSERNVRAVLGDALAAQVSAFECDVSIFGKTRRLKRTLRRLDRSPTDAVYVGDEIRDAQAARAVGIDFLGVGWGYTLADALQAHAPMKVCSNSQEILAAIAAD